MALKKINEEPKITDTILFEITTPDVNGCYVQNPYKVDRVTIYYVERDFLGDNFGEYTKIIVDDSLANKLLEVEKKFCNDPTPANSFEVQKLQSEIDSSSQKNTFYYKDRITVKVIGNTEFPAWLSTDIEKSSLTAISEDENGDPLYGRFTYEWNPEGSVREGDYFICWTWTPNPDGDSLSAHMPFLLLGDPKAVITIPTHITPEEKYEVLLERYLPDLYKNTLSDDDVTPVVTSLLNKSIGKGFKFLEDMSNQIIDLFDANALHESMLVYLSNMFNLKLKSNDPTLWRRQIKEAVPLFKKKGTLGGLKDAFAQSGMILNKFTQFWQLVSPYTWTESFKVKTSPSFTLAKSNIILPIEEENFGIWLKRADSDEYIAISKDYVSFDTDNSGYIKMTWIGDELSAAPIDLYQGDSIKVMYQHSEIPGSTEQGYENYIRSLPLADQREENDQEYPPKNWNVRLITEEDPLFDILVTVRHPFQEWLIFGYVRTEFAYSENIYNMEEYNGSTRPSYDSCRIDKNFLDPCGSCISSKYMVDIAVEELSNDRMLEAQDILREYTPFHAQLHSINFTGEVNEFVPSPEESVDFLVTIDKMQFVLSGQSNPFFHRIMEGGLSDWIVTREDITDQNTVLSNSLGTAYNESVGLVTPDIILQDLGVDVNSHILEILAPSPNAGTYHINQIFRNSARVSSTTIEPVDQSAFTFNLSNIVYGNSTTTITQDDLFDFTDDNIDFSLIGVKTQWDVVNTPNYTGGSWKILMPSYRGTPYEIEDIKNGTLYLDGDINLPLTTTSGINYSILDDNDNVIATSTSGEIKIKRRGYVNLNDTFLVDIENFIKVNDYLFYDGLEYRITEFDGSNFWIEGYTDGSASGVTVSTRRRLVHQKVGYFGYRGLLLRTSSNHESEFEIVNGDNPPPENSITDGNNFKENYLFFIDGEFFKIASINEDWVVLSGREQNWKTIAVGGTPVTYSLVHFPKKEINIGFTVFDHLDRNGKDPVIQEIESTVDNNMAIVALSMPNGSGVQENVAQEEGITFLVETRNGEEYEGEL